jgi:2-polyprenyl-3-methyl-5-hydroxy-6-metoxy-1,4-benzoquinol methylase
MERTLGSLTIEPLANGKRRLVAEPPPGRVLRHRSWVTAYPDELIKEIYAEKGAYACDEIMREEDPRGVEHSVRHEVLSYARPEEFAGKRILDFGCGAGASTLVLARLLPPCDLVGIELEARLLRLAKLRAEYFGRSLQFMCSPAGGALPPELGQFDFIVFSAVYEHLLPHERAVLMPKLWSHLKPGGVLFLNQTPFRYSPIETHTTGLPLINYLPDSLTLKVARRFAKRVRPDEDWETLLRRGTRGGTIRQICRELGGPGRPEVLQPLPEAGDRIDVWHAKLSKKLAWLKRSIWASLKAIKLGTGAVISPTLSLAFRKPVMPPASTH